LNHSRSPGFQPGVLGFDASAHRARFDFVVDGDNFGFRAAALELPGGAFDAVRETRL
jgi:hypothetical protein